MKAEIIAVGSEMLTPDHLDTNSLFITERLNEAGFQVRFKTVVGDDHQDLTDAVQSALRRSKLIIITYSPTYLDGQADVVIHEDVVRVLPPIVDVVIQGSP